MSLSLSDIAIPSFLAGLTSLKDVLAKAAAHADAKKIKEPALLDARLFPDMFTLSKQVQVACDSARRGIDRLVGVEPTSVPDDEKSFAELVTRVETTIATLKAVSREKIDASEDREFTVDIGQPMTFTGRRFLMTFALPNFFFHVTTAYAILRHSGVELGKRDFLAPFIAGS
jgi:hypothetical protein